MTIHRKDLRALAQILGEHNASEALIVAIADWCSASNPLFKRRKFYEAIVEYKHSKGKGNDTQTTRR